MRAQQTLKPQEWRLPLPSPFQIPNPQDNDTGIAPIYGLQGVLIETLDGKLVSAQATDQAFNPASAIKLATAFVALRNFGPNHRFTTGFWTTGSFDKATATINGDLYVTGRDPSFSETRHNDRPHLNLLGIRTVPAT